MPDSASAQPPVRQHEDLTRIPSVVSSIIDADGPGAAWRALEMATHFATIAGREFIISRPGVAQRKQFFGALVAAVRSLEGMALRMLDARDPGPSGAEPRAEG